ncbi:MAG: hypothetical protein ACRD40_16860 [Candidatus Acidiferrales bacterium]
MRRFLFMFLFAVVLSCSGPPASAAIQLVQSSAGDNSNGNGGPYTLPFSTPNSAGDLIIVSVSDLNSNLTSDSVSDTLGNGYMLATNTTNSEPSNTLQSQIYYAANIASGANTITVNFSAWDNRTTVQIFEYSGVATTSPLDQTTSNVGNSSSLDSGLVTTTQVNELVFGIGFGNSGGTLMEGSGYTMEQYFSCSACSTHLGGEDRVASTIGTYDATFTDSNSYGWIAQIVTFKAAGAAGAGICGEPVTTGSAAPRRLPSNYTTQPLPTQGVAFTDTDFNTTSPCAYYRLSTGDNVSPAIPTYHSYIYSPFSCDDNLELVGTPDVGTFAIINVPSGTVYRSSVPFGDNNSQPLWAHCGHGIDNIDSKVLYYHDAAGTKLYRYHADSNLTDVIHDFSVDGYTSICFGCNTNGPHSGMQTNLDDTIGILAQKTDGSWDSFVYDMRNGVQITATAVHSATRPDSNQSLPSHRIIVGDSSCTWSLYDTYGNLVRILPSIGGCVHNMASGYLASDNTMHEAIFYDAVNDSNGGPCNVQYGHGPGIARLDVDSLSKGCVADVGWDGHHISITQDGKWIATGHYDSVNQQTGCTNAYYQANPSLNWQQYFTFIPGEVTSLYTQELDLARTDGSTTYRLAHHRSRGMDNSTCTESIDGGPYDYWSYPRNAISYSGKWIAFDSNYGTTYYPTTGPHPYADTYALLTGLVQ